VDFRPIAPATVWVPSCSRLILIATGLRGALVALPIRAS